MNWKHALVPLVAAVAVAGCSSAATAPTAKTAPLAGTQDGNALVCQHYLKQRAWAKSLTFPTLADGLKFAEYIAADAAEASGRLQADLTDMSRGQQQKHGYSTHAASLRVLRDCAG